MSLYFSKVIDTVFLIIRLLILVRIILSWIPITRNSLTDFIYNLTEPLLSPIRKLLNKSPLGKGLMLDFSPIVLFLLLEVLRRIISSVLYGL